MAIPTSMHGVCDKFIWNGTTSGVYTTKSEYHFFYGLAIIGGVVILFDPFFSGWVLEEDLERKLSPLMQRGDLARSPQYFSNL